MNRTTTRTAAGGLLTFMLAVAGASAAAAGPGPTPTPPPAGRCAALRLEGQLVSYYRCEFATPAAAPAPRPLVRRHHPHHPRAWWLRWV